jgi:hypothetical protein
MSRRKILLVVTSLLLLGATVFLLWPREAGLRLKIVRQTVENGKPVVFFRVEGNGRIIITDVNQITGDAWQVPMWASQGPPFDGLTTRRKEFGVIAPRNTLVWKPTVWKLQVSVVEELDIFNRLKTMRAGWLGLGAHVDKSTLGKARGFWNTFLPGSQQSIESDFITNAFSQP